MRTISEEGIRAFEEQLYLNERSGATAAKYVRAVRRSV